MHRSGTVGRHARLCGALALLGQSLGANDRNFSVGPKIPQIKGATARPPPYQRHYTSPSIKAAIRAWLCAASDSPKAMSRRR